MSTRQLSVMSYTMARGKWWEKPDVSSEERVRAVLAVFTS